MEEGTEEAPVGLVDETPIPESVESGDEFASDMWPDAGSEDNDQGEDSTAAPAPSEAPSFDPSSVNLARTTEDEVPEEYRPMFSEMQKQFKGLQPTRNERNREFEELSAQQAPAQSQEPPRLAPQPNQDSNSLPTTQQNPYPFLEERVQTAINNGQITYEQAAGVRQEMIDGAQQVEQIVNHLFTPYLPYLNVLPQMADYLGNMIQLQQNEATATMDSDFAEASAVYGEAVEAWKPMIQALVGQVNPVTNQPFTVDTATQHHLGITAVQAEELREKHKAAVSGARRKLGKPGAPKAPVAAPNGRHLTEEQADRQMAQAGWDR